MIKSVFWCLRPDACLIMFMDAIIPLVPTSAITLSMGA